MKWSRHDPPIKILIMVTSQKVEMVVHTLHCTLIENIFLPSGLNKYLDPYGMKITTIKIQNNPGYRK